MNAAECSATWLSAPRFVHHSPLTTHHSLAIALCSLCVLCGELRAEITGKDVQQAIARGVAYLRQAQAVDGSWQYGNRQEYIQGATALVVLALVNAGVPADDPAVLTGITYFTSREHTNTYSTSLVAMALAEADPKKYFAKIEEAAQWLMRNQNQDGTWSYMGVLRGRSYDNSNTQFGVLGLHAAARAGVAIPKEVWEKIEDHFRSTQNRDGGWGYHGGRQADASYGSMTCAGLGSLFICDGRLHYETDVCGKYIEDKAIAAGLNWLGKFFTVTENPGKKTSWHYYYLYGIERVGVIAAMKYIGGHDWYREGAEQILRRQSRDGSWYSVVDTAFALLFLGKGRAPVLFNKLRWRGDWNNDRHDLENLSRFISETFGQKLSWQTVDLGAPLTEWLEAPILFLNGHTGPKLTPQEIQKLAEYVGQGGFIFAEACCARIDFDAGFRAIMAQAFPERQLERLEADHPIYRSFFKIEGKVPLLYGLSVSCRTSVVFSPTDLSCFWERENVKSGAFEMGTNIAAYATGMDPLRDKLDKISLVAAKRGAEEPPPRGALIIAQVRHQGDWHPDPLSMNRLLAELREKANVDVGVEKRPVKLVDSDLFDYAVLYMTGHRRFELAAEEKARLRRYLERGGFLFADACCGKTEFDEAFRSLMKDLFPKNPLEALPQGHALFETGHKIKTVKYRKALQATLPGDQPPHLEAVTLEGKIAVVYSKHNFGCGLENHPCSECKGLLPEDAMRVAFNIVLYGLTN
ncbi:MAG: DUF4159 domain-containing protein [Planctomycetes bacterium]|nr:DUF4159 domain-containing protein [Planctomycetota bacterium]